MSVAPLAMPLICTEFASERGKASWNSGPSLDGQPEMSNYCCLPDRAGDADLEDDGDRIRRGPMI
jgi:hypothetical protein